MTVVGALLAERFEIEALAASGGMGRVYRARDRSTGQLVALKILMSEGEHARFDREARLLATLDHPGIVRYVAHGTTDEGQPYLAMEWIDGETLTKRVNHEELGIEKSLAVVRRVAEALAAAHSRGIVHRDVKPGNVMLEGGSIDKIRLIDFGVAHVGGEASLTTHTGFVGTPSYMAPEQARGDRDIGPPADIFSLGCVLHRCLIGQPPFKGDNMVAVLAKVLLEDPPHLRELRKDIPLALDDLVTAMLAKDPEDRPQNASVVCSRLASLDMALKTVPPAPSSRTALGGGEARVVSVLMVGPPPQDSIARVREVLQSSLGGAAARIERVRDGSFVVLVRGRGTAADEATGAATAGLAIRAIFPEAQISVSTGRAELAGDRLPVGEVIDRAGQLLRASGMGEIRLDDLTASLLDDRFVRTKAETGVLLTGRGDEMVGRRLLGKPTPFVGREAELATLEGTIERAFEDRMAKTLLVTGPAGSGKSRLRHELTARIARTGADVWVARADPMGSTTALGLAGQMLRELVGVREGEPDHVRQDMLRERVARHAPRADIERITLFLAESIGAPFEDEASPLLPAARREPLALGDQIRRAWMDFFDAETHAHPLLVVLEDLHWADRGTVALLEAALSTFSERPFAVLGVARPEVEQTFPGLWRERDVQVLRLGPLSKRASAELVRAALGTRGDAVAAKLAEACNGNAFYLEELIRATAEGRGDTLPESVVAMVQSRLETLEADDRRVLRAASIFGRVFWPDGVAHLLGGEHASDLVRRLERLVRAELVVERRESTFQKHAEMSFRHALLREGAYAMLTDDDRTLGHRLAAEWLVSAGSDDAAAVAAHFERGDDKVHGARWWARAAAQGLEGNDLFGVLDLADRASGLEPDAATIGQISAARATALRWLGRFVEAEQHALRAVAHLSPSPQWAEAQMARATALLVTGRADQLVALKDEIMQLLATQRPEILDVAAHVARCLLQAGRGELCDAMLDAVERALPPTAEHAVRSRLRFIRALQGMYAGETSATLKEIETCVVELDNAGDVRTACMARVNAAFNQMSLGGFAEAERLLRNALDVSRRLGLVSQAVSASENLGFTVARLGRLEEGAEIERQTAQLSARNGDRRMEGGARVYLATILVEMGKPAEAEVEARVAVALLEGVPPLLAAAFAAHAFALLALGRIDEALSASTEAIHIADTSRVSEDEGPIRLVHALALEANGRHDEACATIRVACDRLLERASRFDSAKLTKQFLEGVPEHARTFDLARAWKVSS